MKYQTPAQQRENRITVHPSQRQSHVTPVNAKLYVVTFISNSHRFAVRYRLYQAFEKMVSDAGAILITVELALRDRHHEITNPENPHHLQLRSPDIMWHKENGLNLGMEHAIKLYPDAEYFGFMDADIFFTRTDWAVETIHQLQIYRWLQMWSHSIDLAPDSEHNITAYQQPIAQCQSLIYSYMQDRDILKPIDRKAAKNGNGAGNPAATGRGPGIFRLSDAYVTPSPRGMLHTGYAWAARRSALSDVGGLGDIGILGSGDRHMGYALIGEVARSIDPRLEQSYKDYWLRWQHRADRFVQRKVGVVPGTILHYWHGSKQHRRYQDRWKILIENKFDYLDDLKRDPQGLWALTDEKWQLRDDLINYFRVRNEDEITL